MSTYVIGDNTGGKYIPGKDGKAAEDILKLPTLFVKYNEDATALGLKLLHDRGAVYTYLKEADNETNVAIAATGSDPVIRNFEKCDGVDYDIVNAVIPYTTHTECMVAFGGRTCWLNNGKELKSETMASGSNTSNVELADGITVVDLSGFGLNGVFQHYP